MGELQDFNCWYNQNYKKIMTWAINNRIDADTVHDSYIKVNERITKLGYTGSTYMTYIKRSIQNLNINNKLKKKYNHIDIDNTDFKNTIEKKLMDTDDFHKDDQLYQEQLMYFSKNLFKYIDSQSYDDEWKFVFKSYFLASGRFTYHKLTEVTGINKNKCTEIITTMKSDIRDNLINYIKKTEDDQRRNHRSNG